ncbi:hypothetical protein MHEI_42090 [Mycobacterium heidelbergense]|nr:hypothetical protein MHEI_42090 [Mycobacterium heidelbergense]
MRSPTGWRRLVRLDSTNQLRLDSTNYAACSLGSFARAGGVLMYVCLCVGATNQTVSDAVARGASTSKEVAAACGAGGDCGRCRRTLRAIIAAAHEFESTPSR